MPLGLDGTGATPRPATSSVGPTVDDLVDDARREQVVHVVGRRRRSTFGRFEGQELELQLPADDVLSTCDKERGDTTGNYFVFPTGFYAHGPDSRWHLDIVDVDGTRLIVMVSIAEGTATADIHGRRRPIVDAESRSVQRSRPSPSGHRAGAGASA